MPSYEEDLSEFERLDAQVLGISVDNIPSNEAWAKIMEGLSYPLLSDFWPHGLVSLKYNSLRESGSIARTRRGRTHRRAYGAAFFLRFFDQAQGAAVKDISGHVAGD